MTSVASSTASWMLAEPRRPGARSVARLESIGVKLPERRLTTRDLMATTRHHTGIDLERLTGIRERRICSEGEDSLTLAVDAARDCLARSRHRASDLDMVVCTSITRYVGGPSYVFEPPLSLFIKEAIGAPGAASFDLSNACAGMMTGVFLLNELIGRGAIRRGMVVSGEFISGLGANAAREIHGIYSRQLASLTLGDAGAAVIVDRAEGGTPGILFAGFTTLSEHSRLCFGYPAPHLPGAKMLTKARTIHKVAMQDAPPLLEEVLESTGLRVTDIDWLIPHQTSARAIRAGERVLAERLGGAPRNTVISCDELGNTASTTHFLALRRWLDAGKMREGEKVLLLSLASGLEVGIVVFVLDELVRTTHGNAY
jgi:3-oxoacyl-[acyl-carrier-protein] synthase III